ncbi:acyltransferase family protein [Bradyrhizobium elkanii]|uniref:Peptidoglycan/LPS O-acetylase OafA/YrhL n=1 Tax=Bradyrhizobium elkanii TaxID=29448 RepID=A0A8I2C9P0_BRAEL|nr:acyltransferase family protein [Bradyrhizobium elkanii]MBP1299753.1 peptidoglycan/LPS O-acetylase OafA/YrhL [Bradyrhizobium elkanii]
MVKQIPALTGIRFVAAAAVALSHGGSLFLEGTSLALDISIGTLGLFGMSVFFTLSGFVIQYNYGSSIAGSPRKAIPEFLVARIARIYPLFVVLFLVELLTGPMVWPWFLGTKAAAEGFSWHIVPFQLGMIQTWFFANVAGVAPVWQYEEIGIVSWSVSTEWFFYLFFPLVCPVLARIRTALAAILCAIGAGTIELGIDLAVYMLQGRINLFALHAYGTGAALPNWKNTLILWIVYFSPFCRVWEFVLGCCLARLHEAWLAQDFRPSRALLDIAAIVGVGAIGWVFWFTAHKPPFGAAMSLFDIGRNNIALAAPIALILVAAAQPVSSAGRLLSARWLVFLGEASFALYLVHIIIYQRFPVVRWETASQLLGHLGALALAFTLATCVAILLHFGLEVPARRRIRSCYQAASLEQRRRLVRLGSIGLAALVGAAATYALRDAAGDAVTQSGISVVSATYGGNCRWISARGNATGAVAAACNGKDACTFSAGTARIGDPAPGCAKEFTAAWFCKGDRTIRSSSAADERAMISALQLSCNAVTRDE